MNYVRHLHKRLKHGLLSLLAGVLTLGLFPRLPLRLLSTIKRHQKRTKTPADNFSLSR